MPRAMTGRASEVPRRYTFYDCLSDRDRCQWEDSNLVDAVGLDSRVYQFSDEFASHILFVFYLVFVSRIRQSDRAYLFEKFRGSGRQGFFLGSFKVLLHGSVRA